MRMFVAAVACALVDASRPGVRVARGIGERGEGLAQVHVAGPAERDCTVLSCPCHEVDEVTVMKNMQRTWLGPCLVVLAGGFV